MCKSPGDFGSASNTALVVRRVSLVSAFYSSSLSMNHCTGITTQHHSVPPLCRLAWISLGFLLWKLASKLQIADPLISLHGRQSQSRPHRQSRVYTQLLAGPGRTWHWRRPQLRPDVGCSDPEAVDKIMEYGRNASSEISGRHDSESATQRADSKGFAFRFRNAQQI